jgi:hypothetical protein
MPEGNGQKAMGLQQGCKPIFLTTLKYGLAPLSNRMQSLAGIFRTSINMVIPYWDVLFTCAPMLLKGFSPNVATAQ